MQPLRRANASGDWPARFKPLVALAVLDHYKDGTPPEQLLEGAVDDPVPFVQRASNIIAAIDDVVSDHPDLRDDCLDVIRGYYEKS
jgi:hypothetical protein